MRPRSPQLSLTESRPVGPTDPTSPFAPSPEHSVRVCQLLAPPTVREAHFWEPSAALAEPQLGREMLRFSSKALLLSYSDSPAASRASSQSR